MMFGPGGSAESDLVVETPIGRETERAYALSVLLQDWLGIPFHAQVVPGLTETRVRLAGAPEGPYIALPDLLLGPTTSWLARASLPKAPLETVAAPSWSGIDTRLPLLFASPPAGDGLSRANGLRHEFRIDLLGSLFFLLSRYEEMVEGAARDDRDRFPGSASILYPEGWLEWPILDMYVAAFVALLRRLWPAISVRSQSGGAILSHDVDHPGSVFRWHGVERIRVLAGDGIRRRDPGLLIRRAASFLPSRRGIGPLDPFDTFSFLMSASEAVGTRSIFFFMTDETEIPDGSAYRVDRPWAARLIREIAAREHSVGLHGSYRSFVDPDRLRAEWARLEGARPGLQPKVIRRTIRQHFLRFRAGATWRAQASAGFVEDHSLGFADAIGYRAGTARKFPAYDIERGESLPLQVRPLHVMDVALLQRTTGPLSERLRRVADMGARTRRYGGELSLLWHNSSLETNAAKAQYLSLVRELFGS